LTLHVGRTIAATSVATLSAVVYLVILKTNIDSLIIDCIFPSPFGHNNRYAYTTV